MHEFGVAQEMCRIALEQANQNGAGRITRFNIAMSAAADESPDSLRFHIETLSRGTLAEGAQIEIERVPVQATCLDCATAFEWRLEDSVCPHCSGSHIRVSVEDEIRLVSIEVD